MSSSIKKLKVKKLVIAERSIPNKIQLLRKAKGQQGVKNFWSAECALCAK